MDTSTALICRLSDSNIYILIRQLLGLCYQNGTGVVKDKVEGVKYYKIAADQGYASAQYNLGGTLIRVQR